MQQKNQKLMNSLNLQKSAEFKLKAKHLKDKETFKIAKR